MNPASPKVQSSGFALTHKGAANVQNNAITNEVPVNKEGIIVLLDALGVSSHHIEDARKFYQQRMRFLAFAEKKWSEKDSDGEARINTDRLDVFQFGDTMLLAYESSEQNLYVDLRRLLVVLRAGFVHAMNDHLLLRGSVSIGAFISDEDSNTAIGPAVSDAADWYEAADWAGILLTPKASLYFRSMRERENSYNHLAVDYEVPFKGKDPARNETCNLIACNWVKYLSITSSIDGLKDRDTKAWVQQKLSERGIPKGTERKAINTLKFHDVVKAQLNELSEKKLNRHNQESR